MALAILVFIGVLSCRSVLRSREDVWWMTHTHEVLEQIDGVMAAMTDAETGQRGFVVTGDLTDFPASCSNPAARNSDQNARNSCSAFAPRRSIWGTS